MRGRWLKVPVVVVSLFGFLFVSPVAGLTGAGQLRTDGRIIGQVTDESAAVLPGVTVTATSPALQVESVTAVTDGNGEYRLTPLPIGLYTVQYSLSSFRTLRRDGIRLTVGFTARVDVVLTVGQVEQAVTVTGQSPLIDTTVAATTTQVTRENMEIIPVLVIRSPADIEVRTGARRELHQADVTIAARPGAHVEHDAGIFLEQVGHVCRRGQFQSGPQARSDDRKAIGIDR